MMTTDQAQKFLTLLGVDRLDPVNGGTKVRGCCPFAQWTHQSGSDAKPSFALFMSARGHWYFNCLTCGKKGHAIKLWWELLFIGANPPAEASCLVYGDSAGEPPAVAQLDYRVAAAPEQGCEIRPLEIPAIPGRRGQGELFGQKAKKPVQSYEPPTEKDAAKYRASGMPVWVSERGFEDAHRAWGCGYDDRARRWTVPVRDFDGKLWGFTSRITWERDTCFRCGVSLMQPNKAGELRKVTKCVGCGQLYVKWLHTKGMPRNELLLGSHLYQPDHPIILVEGPGDAMRLWQHGVRFPMATFGSNAAMTQIESVLDHTQDIFVMGDGDDAGREMNRIVTELCGEYGVVPKVVRVPEGADPGVLDAETVRSLLPERCFDGPVQAAP